VHDSTSTIEVAEDSRNHNCHDFEVDLHSTNRLPLDRGDVHSVDRLSGIGGHLDHEQSETSQEVQTSDILNLVNPAETITQRHRGVITTKTSVVVVHITVPAAAVVHHVRTVVIVSSQDILHAKNVTHRHFRVCARRSCVSRRVTVRVVCVAVDLGGSQAVTTRTSKRHASSRANINLSS